MSWGGRRPLAQIKQLIRAEPQNIAHHRIHLARTASGMTRNHIIECNLTFEHAVDQNTRKGFSLAIQSRFLQHTVQHQIGVTVLLIDAQQNPERDIPRIHRIHRSFLLPKISKSRSRLRTAVNAAARYVIAAARRTFFAP